MSNPTILEIISSFNGFEDNAGITVTGGGNTPDPSNVSLVVVNPSFGSIEEKGESVTFTAKAVLTDGSQFTINEGGEWRSSDPSIATVDSLGTVTAVSNGTAVISCTYGGITGTAQLQVDMAELTGLRLDPSGGITLKSAGDQYALKVFAVYSKGSEIEMTLSPDVSWQVDNSGIAVCDSTGKVPAVSEGSAQLTAQFSGFSTSCSISVVFPHPALSVSTTEVTLTAAKGTDGSAGSFDITNTGTGIMSYTVVEADDWLGVRPASGTLDQGQTASVTVTPSASGRDTGTYTGVITVTAPGAANAPQYITVNLEVTENTGPTGGDFTNSLGR